jgi:capsular exopolysaccharide synthesis family protein
VAHEVESGLGGRYGRDDDEQPIELRRHLDALRRSRAGIAALVIVMTAAAVGISVALPKSYKATARILYNASADPLSNPSSDVVQRQMATIGALITTPSTLLRAAPAAGFSERQLEKKVAASVDPRADIINVTATDGTAAGAQRIANAVARAFLIAQKQADLSLLASARSKLLNQLAVLNGTTSGKLEAQAIRQRLSELTVSEASAGSELKLAEAAQRPSAPASPKPLRNGIVVFFASLFLGVLLALGRDQLVPRLSGPRELTRVTDRPVLTSIPFVRRRFGKQPTVLSAPEHESYQTLQATIRFQLPPSEQHIILVTSALEGEGKTTVTANLGTALARAGHKTLLVSGDMRHPRLHERFGLRQGPGLAEVLTALEYAGDPELAVKVPELRELLQAQPGSRGNLHVLGSGVKPVNPARLLLSESLPLLFEQFRALEHSYILIDGTPLLGIADSQAVAQQVDDVLMVSRLDRLRTDDVIEVRDLLDRLDVIPLGHVVVGGRRTGSSYYYAERPSELETA